MATLSNIVSFGGHYAAASLVYFGMSFLLLCSTPEIIAYARANDEQPVGCTHEIIEIREEGPVPVQVDGCPAGYSCCEATGACELVE